MKSSYAKTLVVLALIAGQVSAQESMNSSTSESSMPSASETDPVNGFQVGVRKGFSEKAEVEIEGNGSVGPTDNDFTHLFGVGVGYAKHNFQSIGFKGGLNYDHFENDGEGDSFAAMNLEGNGTFMVNQHFIPYGGVNLNKYVSGGAIEDMALAIGFQVGFTGQMIDQLSYQAAWQSINNTDSVDGTDIDVSVSTIQVGLIYTL